MPTRRSRELKPLTSEHEQALLVAYQIRKGIAGHGESAGAPKDLPGLVALAKRYDETVFATHTRAEEDLLASLLGEGDLERMRAEHAEMRRLLDTAREADPGDARNALAQFADRLERHVRWEEKELFPAFERAVGAERLATIGEEIERRLAVARGEQRQAKRAQG